MEVRKPKFDFNNVKKEWLSDNTIFTNVANSLFLLFPEGERFFIRSVKQFADKADTEQLKQDIKTFIAQEVQHGKAHEYHFEELERQGYDVQPYLRAIDKFAYGFVEPVFKQLFGDEIALSTTAAAEHYTAILAKMAIDAGLVDKITDETMKDLVSWHCIEEIEHKHVTFDLLKKVDESYVTRMGGFAIGTTMFIGLGLVGFVYLMSKERDIKTGCQLNLGSVVNNLSILLKNVAKYLKPDFHPSQI